MTHSNLLSLAFIQQQPKAAAGLIQEFPPEQAADFLLQVPGSDLVAVFNEMASWPAARLLSLLPTLLVAEILGAMTGNDAETLLRLVGGEQRDQVLEHMPKSLAKSFAQKLAYPVSTVGAWMDTGIPYFTLDSSVNHCLDLVKRKNIRLGGVLMVVNDSRQLIGLVEVEKLLTTEGSENLSNLMQTDIDALPARATLWEVEHNTGWTEFPTLPVVDHDHIMLGALTHSALKMGMSDTAKPADDALKFSLVAHMGKAFFVALGGLLQVVSGVSGNASAQSANRYADKQPNQEEFHG